jgi:hypothetical protein
VVVCMKWGRRYGPDYVNRLYAGVVRGMGGELFRMVCMTDDAAGVRPEVECVPLPDFPDEPKALAMTPWRKLSLWQPRLGHGLDGQDAVFLDLDVVLVGDVRRLFKVHPGADFVVWENPTKRGRGIGNTSVFRWRVGAHPEIFEMYVRDAMALQRQHRIEQQWISACLGPGGGDVQRYFPDGWCVSFKEDLLPGWPWRWWQRVPMPAGASVVVFHGKPDPDEALAGQWPAKGWKKIYKTIRPVEWIADFWRI